MKRYGRYGKPFGLGFACAYALITLEFWFGNRFARWVYKPYEFGEVDMPALEAYMADMATVD